MKKIIPFFFTALAFYSSLYSCKTVDLEKTDAAAVKNAESKSEEEKQNEQELREFFIEEELKEIDVEKTVIYVDRPVYITDGKITVGNETHAANNPADESTVKKSQDASQKTPVKYVNGIMYYAWDETLVYEIYCQPYRITDIALEPGELVMEEPFLSEDKVWEISAGVSKQNGADVQHFFLKPAYAKLTTSMIVITDRRVYHLLLKSIPDTYMVMVRWTYPRRPSYSASSILSHNNPNRVIQDAALVNPEFLSFDYKMSYSLFKKPVWLPKRVYDDGRKTYIVLDETVLHTTSPVLFNQKNERVNYRTSKNVLIIDSLIEKITLRSGTEKVTVTKKKTIPHNAQAAEE